MRVSYFTGIFSGGVFAILLFVFLWNFWLEDLFRTAERVDVPDFTGKSYEAVVNDKQYADYHFTVVYTVDPDVPDGIIIEQDPAAGKSRMRVSDGINVQLTVSTGVVMTDVPYVINEDYEKATAALEKAGFTVTTEFQASKDVTAKYVISCEPAPGEKAAAGPSVKQIVSGGPELRPATVPDLSELTESAAIARIEARCNTEPSASTGVPPAVLFMREKEELRKVGNMGLLESMVADVSVQAVPPTMLVRCRGREFSVPRRCIGRRVKVLAMPSGQVRVEKAGETDAVHDLTAPGGPVVYDPAHYAEALAAKARYADADIEAAARANLELLGRLGEGSL